MENMDATFEAEPFKAMFARWDSNMAWLKGRTIFLTLHGSHAYGTSTPSSDHDYKGIAVPPREYFLGYHKRFEQAEHKGDPDAVIFDIRKFIHLAVDNNPNIIEILFTDPSSWVYCERSMKRLLDARDTFISKKAKHTFSGYATAQLKRINTHYRWLKSPPKAPPTRAEFGLPESTLLPRDQMDAAQALIRKRIEDWELDLEPLLPDQRINVQGRIEQMLSEIAGWAKVSSEDVQWRAAADLTSLDPNVIAHLEREKKYRGKLTEWKQYEEWKKTRNPARAALEEKYGYDTKHGMHLVRLTRMCREILEGKGLIVMRPDAAELLEIRGGSWPYEQLVEWANKEDLALDELYKTSPLPKEPPREKIDRLCVEMVEEWIRNDA